MIRILERSDAEIIQEACKSKQWDEVSSARRRAVKANRSELLIENLRQRMTIIWYKYEKQW